MPKLHFFNPGHETAVLNGSPHYTAPTNIAKMQNDLAFLPAWYALPEDFVLLDNKLPDSFKKYLSENLNSLAKSITVDEFQSIEKKTTICPWGVSIQILRFFEELNHKSNSNLKMPMYHNRLKELISRQTAAFCLERLCYSIPEVSDSIIPAFYTHLDDIEKEVDKSEYQLLAKAPYSSSGRGLLWLPIEGLTRTERQILQGILNKQNTVSLERALAKKLDFAMEFAIDDDEQIVFEGYSLFQTNSKGSYLGNYIGSQASIIEQIEQFIPKMLLDNVKTELSSIIKEKFAGLYSGCIGVDMMIYEDNENYRLHPCVEINVRYNMGYLALKMSENHVDSNFKGYFYIDFNNFDGNILNKHEENKQLYPALFKDGKLQSGYLSLCPITSTTKYHAYIIAK